jgi:hypothetical protein
MLYKLKLFMNKTIFLGLTIGVIAVGLITLSAVSMLDFIAMGVKISGTETCTSDFWSRTCCWAEQGPSSVARVCETCLDNGDGTYRDCKTRPERFGGIFQGDIIPTPGPAQGGIPAPGGIFQGDIIPTPGPAAQDTPTGGSMPRSGIFQGNLLESYSQPGLVQSDPDSVTPPETNTTQPGGIFREDLEQLGATQDNETTSEDGVTEEPPTPEENTIAVPPATEEAQPALVQEEPVPPCPEGQVLDEETNLCALEEPQGDEQSEEEPQTEEVEQSSEEEGSEENSNDN